MSADDYNAAQITAGKLTTAHITELVRFWQLAHSLVVDGYAGDKTIATFGRPLAPPKLHLPLPILPDGRAPMVTQRFRPADNPDHNGVDWFYRYKPGDHPDWVGNAGAAGPKDGPPAWVVPYGVPAIAAAAGVVQLADNSLTGYRLWIDHGDGWRTGYFHLLDLRVKVGDRVEVGARLGLVGDNPHADDGRHLHFELSPIDNYAPVDPAPYLV